MYAATLAIMLASVSAAPADCECGEYDEYCECGVEATECECGASSDCDGGEGAGGRFGGGGRDSIGRRGGPMPQTCYAPRYGCYPGNNRHMHRYPAFHGVYYRRPYNYRNLFDYPWHAELHEPSSLFSHETPEEEAFEDDEPIDAQEDLPPKPEVDPASSLRPTSARRSASAPRSAASRRPVTLRSASSESRESRLRSVPETKRWRASDVQHRYRPGSAG